MRGRAVGLLCVLMIVVGQAGAVAAEPGLAVQPLDADDVTASATLQGCASLYLVWDAKNSIAFGTIAPTPFGRFYSSQTVDGKTIEKHHRGCDVGRAWMVKLQLGSDCVRMLASEDGKHFERIWCAERPAKLSGGPKYLVIGRYVPPGESAFADVASLPKWDAARPGPVRDVKVDRTRADSLAMTDVEREQIKNDGMDLVRREMLAGNDDPTFEKVAKYYPGFKRPREVVGVADHPLDIGVDRLGRLGVSPWAAPVAWLEAGEPAVAFGTGDQKITRRLLDGYLPVLTLKTERGGVRYEQTVFGYSDAFRTDEKLVAYVRLRAAAGSKASLPRHVSLVTPAGKRSTWDVHDSGENVVECCLSFTFPDPATAVRVAPDDFDAKLKLVADHWRKEIEPAGRFSIPDARIAEAYRAWIVYSMLNTDMINGLPNPRDGAGFYEDCFGISVSEHTMAMDLYGLHDRAQGALEMLMSKQQPSGLYTENAGLPDHGAMIVALAEHYRVTKDVEFLKRAAPHIVSACDWIIQQRAKAPKDGVVKGMIKFRPYCDYPEPVYDYFGDSWCCMGLKSAAEVLAVVGLKADAERFAAEAQRYRQDLLSSMDAAAFGDGDLTLLPMEPETHRLLKAGWNRGGDYYGLTASSMLENGFLDERDPRTKLITDILEQRGGLIAGICEFMKGVDHAYTYGYLMTKLKQDDVRPVILGLHSMMAFGMTRDTYSPVEINMIETGENHLTLPHLYSCTEQLRLLRNMMIREEGETLWIGQAIPRQWLEPGKHVSATDAPTRFGKVSFSIEALADGRMKVHVAAPPGQAVAKVKVRLRHPRMLAIERGLDGGQLNGDTMTFSNVTGTIDGMVSFVR